MNAVEIAPREIRVAVPGSDWIVEVVDYDGQVEIRSYAEEDPGVSLSTILIGPELVPGLIDALRKVLPR